MANTKALFARRQRRARYALRKAANGRPRLSVFRSGKHIYAQIIDDRKGVDRKSTRLNSSHMSESRMPSSA